MRPPQIMVSQTEGALRAAPIQADWVLSGAPKARNRVLSRSRDRTAITVVWDCTAGAFNWFYDSEETIHVLEGAARLTFAGQELVIGPGSVVIFPAGSQARWDVDCYIRKLAIFRQTVPRPFGVAMRAWNRLLSLSSGGRLVRFCRGRSAYRA